MFGEQPWGYFCSNSCALNKVCGRIGVNFYPTFRKVVFACVILTRKENLVSLHIYGVKKPN